MMKTRKEIKDSYKQMKFPMGVFQIRNIINNKVLIDNSIDIDSKWNRHKMELKFGSHKNKDLQNDWIKYGEDSFIFEVLHTLKPDEEKERNYQKELKELQEIIIEEANIKDELRY